MASEESFEREIEAAKATWETVTETPDEYAAVVCAGYAFASAIMDIERRRSAYKQQKLYRLIRHLKRKLAQARAIARA